MQTNAVEIDRLGPLIGFRVAILFDKFNCNVSGQILCMGLLTNPPTVTYITRTMKLDQPVNFVIVFARSEIPNLVIDTSVNSEAIHLLLILSHSSKHNDYHCLPYFQLNCYQLGSETLFC